MAEEALQSVESLLTKIPLWIADLEEIVKGSSERQKAALFENQPAQPTAAALLSPSVETPARLPTLSKKASASSFFSRTTLLRQTLQTATAATTKALRHQLPYLTPSDGLRLAQRNRKTSSIVPNQVDADQSSCGNSQYRSTVPIVVYYDGASQKGFETLVRGIGSARNTLRKGKMSAKVDALSRMEDSSRSNDIGPTDSNNSPDGLFSSSGYYGYNNYTLSSCDVLGPTSNGAEIGSSSSSSSDEDKTPGLDPKAFLAAVAPRRQRRTDLSSNLSPKQRHDVSCVPSSPSPRRSRPRTARGGPIGCADEAAPFDKIDRLLESAQVLCERAAHLVLRDGEAEVAAAEETGRAREKLGEACRIGEEELGLLRSRAEAAREREAREKEREDQEDKMGERAGQGENNIDLTVPLGEEMLALTVESLAIPAATTMTTFGEDSPLSSTTIMDIAAIEPDLEADDSDDLFDMATVLSQACPHRMRSAHVAVH